MAVRVVELEHNFVTIWNIRREVAVASLDTGGVKVSRNNRRTELVSGNVCPNGVQTLRSAWLQKRCSDDGKMSRTVGED